MRALSLVWGIGAFVGFCIALVPCAGWLNWVVVPAGMAGVAISIVAMARGSSQSKSPALWIAGLVLSLIAACLGLVRLVLGGGIL